MSPNAGGEAGGLRGLSQWVQLYLGVQINFGDLTPYLTYEWTREYSLNRAEEVSNCKLLYCYEVKKVSELFCSLGC